MVKAEMAFMDTLWPPLSIFFSIVLFLIQELETLFFYSEGVKNLNKDAIFS